MAWRFCKLSAKASIDWSCNHFALCSDVAHATFVGRGRQQLHMQNFRSRPCLAARKNRRAPCRARDGGSDVAAQRRTNMRFMLMMNAPNCGDGDWSVASWPMEDLRAHIQF